MNNDVVTVRQSSIDKQRIEYAMEVLEKLIAHRRVNGMIAYEDAIKTISELRKQLEALNG